MSAARLIMSIVIATVTIITLAVVAAFGMAVMEPLSAELGSPPDSLGWSDPGSSVLPMAVMGFVGLALVLTIWFIALPVKEDRRQEVRR